MEKQSPLATFLILSHIVAPTLANAGTPFFASGAPGTALPSSAAQSSGNSDSTSNKGANSLPTFASGMPGTEAPGTKPDASGCDGIQVGKKGNLANTIKKRQSEFEKYCGKGGKGGSIAKELDQLKTKLKNSCDNVGGSKGTTGGGGGMSTSMSMMFASGRLDGMCKAYEEYLSGSDKLCKDYAAGAAKTQALAPKTLTGNQANNMLAASNVSASGATSMRQAQASAAGVGKKIDETGVGKDKDPKMEKILADMKQEATRRSDSLLKQANAKLKDRTTTSKDSLGQVDDRGGAKAIRFSTQADVNDFYKKMDACQSVLKNDVAQFNKNYQQAVAKSLADAKSESSNLAGTFGERAGIHQNQASNLAKTADKLGDGSASGISGSSSSKPAFGLNGPNADGAVGGGTAAAGGVSSTVGRVSKADGEAADNLGALDQSTPTRTPASATAPKPAAAALFDPSPTSGGQLTSQFEGSATAPAATTTFSGSSVAPASGSGYTSNYAMSSADQTYATSRGEAVLNEMGMSSSNVEYVNSNEVANNYKPSSLVGTVTKSDGSVWGVYKPNGVGSNFMIPYRK